MTFKKYFSDKIFSVFILLSNMLLVLVFSLFFNVNKLLIIYIAFLNISSCFLILFIDYYRRKLFYKEIDLALKSLDKKYFIVELLNEPSFLEGKIFLDYLYDINKSMIEEINNYKYNSDEFREYLELWCHEIKTPLATSKLILHNHKNKVNDSLLEEMDRIEYYIEQVLYYAKLDSVASDYIINDTDLITIVNNVIKRNKKDILAKKIKVEVNFQSAIVKSDRKWLEFIINQIVTNSIKYINDKNGKLQFNLIKNKNNTILIIKDNGIGIKEDELERVFIKGFTGSNGRNYYNSTGIGLYLCKRLCDKLGHDIVIESKIKKYTLVKIVFPNDSKFSENLTKM